MVNASISILGSNILKSYYFVVGNFVWNTSDVFIVDTTRRNDGALFENCLKGISIMIQIIALPCFDSIRCKFISIFKWCREIWTKPSRYKHTSMNQAIALLFIGGEIVGSYANKKIKKTFHSDSFAAIQTKQLLWQQMHHRRKQ